MLECFPRERGVFLKAEMLSFLSGRILFRSLEQLYTRAKFNDKTKRMTTEILTLVMSILFYRIMSTNVHVHGSVLYCTRFFWHIITSEMKLLSVYEWTWKLGYLRFFLLSIFEFKWEQFDNKTCALYISLSNLISSQLTDIATDSLAFVRSTKCQIVSFKFTGWVLIQILQ